MTAHRNTVPVLTGFWSDPTICRAGDEFYLANSSFEYFPGAPVHRSTDLTSWEHVGHVITRPEQADLSAGTGSSGIYGSTLRYHDGRFWFVTTNRAQLREGQLLFQADDPAGPWSDPVVVRGVIGIDPDLSWDCDGACHLTWADLQHGISQVRIDPRTGAVLSEPVRLWSGTGMRSPEGPHLYHVGDWWYLLIAEGGTGRGHSVSVARSRSRRGPFEGCPANPILTHRSTDHPVQSVGHADLVEGPDGRWHAVFHGTRPRGVFPNFHLLGRETMLAPVTWDDGWPVITETDGLVAPAGHAFTDEFTGALDPRWVTPAGSLSGVATGPAGLTLSAHDQTARPLLTRVRDLEWSATATIDAQGGDVRMLVLLDDAHWYGLEARGGQVSAVARIGPAQQVRAVRELPGSGPLTLRIRTELPSGDPGLLAAEPDTVILESIDGDAVCELARLDGRYLSTEVAGGFTGRMVGVQALSGTVTVRSFAYAGRPH
ncbi:MAG TPA: family 43 glycosylhydrolase [Candidatus Nanopelagicales bacterium]|nr:family 43 glycosylhydrolase [Candidatus Nanopelagicales bacterium]